MERDKQTPIIIALSVPMMMLLVVGIVLNNPLVFGLGILAIIPPIWTAVRE